MFWGVGLWCLGFAFIDGYVEVKNSAAAYIQTATTVVYFLV